MLANEHFYHASIRRYTVMLGGVFNNIKILRQGGGRRELIPVPITYASGHAYYRYTGERDVREKKIPRISKIIPALVFSLTSFSYDPMRKTNSRARITNTVGTADGDTTKYVYGRVPYDFEYEVSVKTKNMDDMLQIVEQIVPYFDPTLVIRIEDIPNDSLDVEQDIPILMTNVQIDDIYEGDLEEHRIIECTMNFTVKGWLYKRVLEGAVVDKINYRYSTEDDADPVALEDLFTAKGEETNDQLVARELNNAIEGALFADVTSDAGLKESGDE